MAGVKGNLPKVANSLTNNLQINIQTSIPQNSNQHTQNIKKPALSAKKSTLGAHMCQLQTCVSSTIFFMMRCQLDKQGLKQLLSFHRSPKTKNYSVCPILRISNIYSLEFASYICYGYGF